MTQPLRAALVAALVPSLGCVGDPPAAELPPERRAMLQARIVEAPPPGTIATDARFGDVDLVGYTLEPRTLSVEAGSEVAVTFVWRVAGALPAGFVPFTHLTDARGRLIANLDSAGPLRALAGVSGPPLPPSRWPEGRYVLDRIDFTMPTDAPEHVQLLTGFFRGHDRHPVAGKAVDTGYRAAWVKLRVAGREGTDPVSVVPTISVPRREGSIVVDGRLDEPAWAAAAETGPFVHAGHGRLDPSLPIGGSARLLWDDEHLFLAFEVRDRDLRGGFAQGAVDPHLWTRDTVEVMIDPDGDNRDYYEIQVGPQGLVFDSRFDDYNLPRGGPDGPFGHQDWSARLTRAVQVDGTLDDARDEDRGYTVEMRLPWRSLAKTGGAPPKPQETWRMNFYAMENNGGVAWSPLLGRGNFHRASRFGRVVFLP